MVRLGVGLLSGDNLPNHQIENWCKENTKDRYAEHPSENGRAQRLPHFRARSRAEHERNYPGDKGKDVMRIAAGGACRLRRRRKWSLPESSICFAN